MTATMSTTMTTTMTTTITTTMTATMIITMTTTVTATMIITMTGIISTTTIFIISKNVPRYHSQEGRLSQAVPSYETVPSAEGERKIGSLEKDPVAVGDVEVLDPYVLRLVRASLCLHSAVLLAHHLTCARRFRCLGRGDIVSCHITRFTDPLLLLLLQLRLGLFELLRVDFLQTTSESTIN